MVTFMTTTRRKTHFSWAVRGISSDGLWSISLFLDPMTGSVLFPVTIKSEGAADISILLSDEKDAFASLPTIIPEHLILPLRDQLTAFSAIVEASRIWIEEEQRLFLEESAEDISFQ